jgi:DNA-binding transcriptional LysR family regulator
LRGGSRPCKQVLRAAPSYLQRHGKPEAVEDLLHHNCIVYTLGRDARTWRVLDDENPELGVYLVYPDRRNLLPKLKALLDFLADSFTDGAEWDRGLGL